MVARGKDEGIVGELRIDMYTWLYLGYVLDSFVQCYAPGQNL